MSDTDRQALVQIAGQRHVGPGALGLPTVEAILAAELLKLDDRLAAGRDVSHGPRITINHEMLAAELKDARIALTMCLGAAARATSDLIPELWRCSPDEGLSDVMRITSEFFKANPVPGDETKGGNDDL